MKKKLVAAIAVVLIIVIGIGAYTLKSKEERKLFFAVRDHVDENGNSTVALGELMDFEWETALYFTFPVSRQDINQAIGATYTGPTDITAGLIFVKDGEVVFYELITSDFDWLNKEPGRFFFNAQIPAYEESNIRFFTHYDEFEVGLTEDGNYYMGRVVSEEEVARGDFVRNDFEFYLRSLQDSDRADRDADLWRTELFVFSVYTYSDGYEYGFVLDMRRGGWVYYDPDTSALRKLKFFAELKEGDLERLIRAIEESGLSDWEYIYESEPGETGSIGWGVGIKFDDGKSFISRGRGTLPESIPPEEQFSALTDFIKIIGAEIIERHTTREMIE